jgi:hypothetical protein
MSAESFGAMNDGAAFIFMTGNHSIIDVSIVPIII